MERYFNKIKADVLKSSYKLIFIYIDIMILLYIILCLDTLSDYLPSRSGNGKILFLL